MFTMKINRTTNAMVFSSSFFRMELFNTGVWNFNVLDGFVIDHRFHNWLLSTFTNHDIIAAFPVGEYRMNFAYTTEPYNLTDKTKVYVTTPMFNNIMVYSGDSLYHLKIIRRGDKRMVQLQKQHGVSVVCLVDGDLVKYSTQASIANNIMKLVRNGEVYISLFGKRFLVYDLMYSTSIRNRESGKNENGFIVRHAGGEVIVYDKNAKELVGSLSRFVNCKHTTVLF